MNMAMTITLDGLVRALRWKEHDLAERIERDYAGRDNRSITAGSEAHGKPARQQAEGVNDDRRGR
jgi:hypothetical protein